MPTYHIGGHPIRLDDSSDLSIRAGINLHPLKEKSRTMDQYNAAWVFSLIVVLATSCAKEGPTGPQGPQGPPGNDNIEIFEDDFTSADHGIVVAPIDWEEDHGLMEVAIPGGLDSGDVVVTLAHVRVTDLDDPINDDNIVVVATNYLAPNSNATPDSGNGFDMSLSNGASSNWDPLNASSMYFHRSSTFTWSGASIPEAYVTLYAVAWDNSTTGNVSFGSGTLTVIIQRYQP